MHFDGDSPIMGCDRGWRAGSPRRRDVSPDDRFVYAVAGGTLNDGTDGVLTFARVAGTGALRPVGCITANGGDGRVGSEGLCQRGDALVGARDIAISPDGETAYVASSGSGGLAWLKRDTLTGRLTPSGCVKDTPRADRCSEMPNLLGASAVAVSPDGNNVYVAAATSGALHAFERDPVTGRPCCGAVPLRDRVGRRVRGRAGPPGRHRPRRGARREERLRGRGQRRRGALRSRSQDRNPHGDRMPARVRPGRRAVPRRGRDRRRGRRRGELRQRRPVRRRVLERGGDQLPRRARRRALPDGLHHPRDRRGRGSASRPSRRGARRAPRYRSPSRSRRPRTDGRSTPPGPTRSPRTVATPPPALCARPAARTRRPAASARRRARSMASGRLRSRPTGPTSTRRRTARTRSPCSARRSRWTRAR